jgi:hypothetical protein
MYYFPKTKSSVLNKLFGICALSLSLSLSSRVEAQFVCPDFSFEFGTPVQAGDMYAVPLYILNHTANQYFLSGADIQIQVNNSGFLDEAMTKASNNIPNPQWALFIEGPGGIFNLTQSSPPSGIDLLPAAAGPGSAGVYEAMTIYVLPAPGEDCQVLSFWGPQPKGIWLEDAFGQQHFCELSSSYPLPVSEEICLPNPFISGTIYKVPPMGECIGSVNYGIPDVTVEMEILNPPPAHTYTTSTFINGNYMREINQIPHIGKDFRVRPVYNDAFLCGLTQHDQSMIQNHILGTQQFLHRWQMIAADVNEDDMITITDVIIIRDAILNNQNPPGVKAWRFHPDGVGVYNPAPFPFPIPFNEYRDVPNLTAPVTQQSFIGIKMGDVDGSCTNCADNPIYYLMDPDADQIEGETRAAGLDLHAVYTVGPQGTTILELLSPYRQILGSTMMLDFSLEGFRFDQPEYSIAPYSPSIDEGACLVVNDAVRYGYINTEHAASTLEAGTVLLRIDLGGALPDKPAILLNGESWRNAQFVDGREQPIRIETVADGSIASDTNLIVWPNPARDQAFVRSNTAQPYRLLDIYGRIVGQGHLQSGLTTLPLDGLGSGLYLLHTEEEVLRLMIVR